MYFRKGFRRVFIFNIAMYLLEIVKWLLFWNRITFYVTIVTERTFFLIRLLHECFDHIDMLKVEYIEEYTRVSQYSLRTLTRQDFLCLLWKIKISNKYCHHYSIHDLLKCSLTTWMQQHGELYWTFLGHVLSRYIKLCSVSYNYSLGARLIDGKDR